MRRASSSDDLLIASPWDADRLQLWRLGIQPDPSRLSTIVARSEWMLRWSFELARISTDVEWADLLDAAREHGNLSPSRWSWRRMSSGRTRRIRLYRAPPAGFEDPSEPGTCWTPSQKLAALVLGKYEHRSGVIWQTDVKYRPDRVLDLTPDFIFCLLEATRSTPEQLRRGFVRTPPYARVVPSNTPARSSRMSRGLPRGGIGLCSGRPPGPVSRRCAFSTASRRHRTATDAAWSPRPSGTDGPQAPRLPRQQWPDGRLRLCRWCAQARATGDVGQGVDHLREDPLPTRSARSGTRRSSSAGAAVDVVVPISARSADVGI